MTNHHDDDDGRDPSADPEEPGDPSKGPVSPTGESPDARSSEGVRILGASEAAESTPGHDASRRRDPSGKRFGDRPEPPDPAGDLPRITISSTEERADADHFGAVPVVPSPEGPTRDRGGLGHARVAPEPEPAANPESEPEPEPKLEWEPEPDVGAGSGPVPADRVVEEPEEWPAERGARGDDVRGYESVEPGGSATDEGWFDEGPFEQSVPRVGEPPDLPAVADPTNGDEGAPEPDDEDSFVLPHWTEPATGQVPRVVGDMPDEQTDAGHQSRWRDLDSGDAEEGFEDLIDDAPRLGALSGQRDPFEDDEDFEDYLSGELGEDDPLAAWGGIDGPFDEPPVRAAPRAPRRDRSRRGSGEDHDDGSVDGSGDSAPSDRNLPVAVGVGVGLVVLGLLCFKLGTLPTAILATVVVTLAGAEYFKALRVAGYNPAALLGMVSIGGFMLAPALFGLAAYPLLIAITVLSALVWYLLVAPGEGSVPNLSMTLLGVFWIGGLGSFAGLFLGLGDVVSDRLSLDTNPGIGVLLAAVIAAVSYDVGGYFIGRRYGRTRLSAASPNKTQEGFGGGILVSVVVTTAAVSFIAPIGDDTIFRTFLFALLCAIAAPIGDLCESFVKRDLDVKDMGTVLPGHGGVLDRFDSLLFVLPVAYFVTVPLGIWTG